MYAVIETGGKQYRVQTGDVIEIEKLTGEIGSKTKFEKVLFCSTEGENSKIWLGKPTLAGATVEGEFVGQGRGEKILIVKMKRRKQYRRTQGHRQELTHVLITGVSNGSGEVVTLSADDKKATLAKFQSHLTPKGGKNGAKLAAAALEKTARNSTAFVAATDTVKKAAPKAAKKSTSAEKTEKKTTTKKTTAKKAE